MFQIFDISSKVRMKKKFAEDFLELFLVGASYIFEKKKYYLQVQILRFLPEFCQYKVTACIDRLLS